MRVLHLRDQILACRVRMDETTRNLDRERVALCTLEMVHQNHRDVWFRCAYNCRSIKDSIFTNAMYFIKCATEIQRKSLGNWCHLDHRRLPAWWGRLWQTILLDVLLLLLRWVCGHQVRNKIKHPVFRFVKIRFVRSHLLREPLRCFHNRRR